MYDDLGLTNKPDLVGTYGFSKIQYVDQGQLWPAGASYDQPDEATVRAVARRLPTNIYVVVDIELLSWPTQVDPNANPPVAQADVDAAIQKYIKVVDWMHNENPNLKIGFYGVLPIRDYWSPFSYLTPATSNAATQAAYIAWQTANDNLQVLAAHVDAIFPSLYTFYDDPAGWQIFAQENLKQAHKYGKPVFPALWPRYHEASVPASLGGQYIDAAFWNQQLNTAKQFTAADGTSYSQDGLVLFDQGVSWTSSATWWSPTLNFISTLKAAPQPSQKFSLTQAVQTTSATAVYNKPSLSATLLQTQAAGAPGTVFGGPVSADGLVWWNVNYNAGADGWSPESGLGLPVPGLVGHWRFDEGSGTRTADISGYANDGVLVHNPGWTPGVEGTALAYDGVSKNYVDLGNKAAFNFGTGDFSLSAWVYYQDPALANAAFISKGMFVQGYPSYFLGIKSGNFVFSFATDVGPQAGGEPASKYAGSWTHVVGVRSGNTLSVYVNGVLKGTAAVDPTAANANVNNAFDLQFGARGAEAGYNLYELMNGKIDEVLIYSRALNTAEVGQLYAMASVGAATVSPAASTTTVWVDDQVPAGAVLMGDREGWNWISSNPSPYSGSLSHQSVLAAGEHQHYFYNATNKLAINTGDSVFAYVYLDPANPPSEVMLQWYDGASWEHRAYWGANTITWGDDGSTGRHYMGALPAAGQWVLLKVPASVVGLENKTASGMAFTLYGGRATWDYAGKSH